MKIALLGSRGIPNTYGGFEQFAERLSVGLAEKGCEVWVYCPHDHSYHEKMWKGVHLVHCYNPKHLLGEAGQFIYDLNCILESRRHSYDIIYQLGYTSSSLWFKLHARKPFLLTNMDGMEWQRAKYNRLTRYFLKKAEKWAVHSSDGIIADSEAISAYLTSNYECSPAFIPYGADQFSPTNTSMANIGDLQPGTYFLCVARLQADNHPETIIRGWQQSGCTEKLVITGNTSNSYGRYLRKTYAHLPGLIFTEGIYKKELLNTLRYNSRICFHGHSCGGTNPSLLEAMACRAFIGAHDNPYNREVLGEHATYFKNEDDIARIISAAPDTSARLTMIEANLHRIEEKYSWDKIVQQYYELFEAKLK